ncbi:hypothetical protein CYMTET_46784 [Cymbomonas tetramitiformis]|uniref:Reverse transcriptase Ty1/copia-type domain-containing protein n=1 Tax=Cymbomonas tetramitiformis TaxID=36881 RepID=A0AAE0BXE2_9CHLO|nr:hypothetical protein CYMTET_46784 [Cymbomonas tetramitiformis]
MMEQGVPMGITAHQYDHSCVQCCPDMAAVSALSKFSTACGPEHFEALKRVLRYLKGTLDYELVLWTMAARGGCGEWTSALTLHGCRVCQVQGNEEIHVRHCGASSSTVQSEEKMENEK